MEKIDRRLEVLRQYLIDIELYPGSVLETAEAFHYFRWNFLMYMKEIFDQHDQVRHITRIMKDQREFGEYKLSELASKSVNLTVGHMGKIIRDPAEFSRWLFLNFVSPIVAEENRYFDHSDQKVVWTVGGVYATVSRSSNQLVLKVSEAVLFPTAKDVPPAHEPSPDEVNPPVAKLE